MKFIYDTCVYDIIWQSFLRTDDVAEPWKLISFLLLYMACYAVEYHFEHKWPFLHRTKTRAKCTWDFPKKGFHIYMDGVFFWGGGLGTKCEEVENFKT